MLNQSSNGPDTWVKASSVAPKSVKWLWYPYIAAENVNILAGMGGEGKGLVAMHLAAAVTRGKGWPSSQESAVPATVLWCEMEDATDVTLVPRMEAAGVDRTRVFVVNAIQLQSLGPEDLRKTIVEKGIRLIVLSPLTSFLAGADTNDETAVRSALGTMLMAVQGTDCAILGICHANKKDGLSAVERILGSVAFVNFCRSVLLVGPDPEGEGSKRLVHAKHNLSPKGPDLLYEPVNVGNDPRDQYVRVEWDKPEANVDHTSFFDRPRHGSRRQSAAQWLEEYLSEHGRVPQNEVLRAAAEAGFKSETIRKAHGRGQKFQTEKEEAFQGRHLWWLGGG